MTDRILIINGHPDPSPGHFVAALAKAYEDGAREAGHDTRLLSVGDMTFPLVRNQADWRDSAPPEDILVAQDAIRWCSHVVVIYPLWLGTMPAILKGFLEQTFRQDFAFNSANTADITARRMKGRSARVVVTMGMPAAIYRWFYGAHSLKALKRNILGFCGFSPVRSTVIGSVEGRGENRQRALRQLRSLGHAGR